MKQSDERKEHHAIIHDRYKERQEDHEEHEERRTMYTSRCT